VFVVVDGVPEKRYEYIDPLSLTFSPDSQRLAYIVSQPYQGSKAFVIVDGVEGKPSQYIDSDVIFSPDSKRMAYVAGRTKLFAFSGFDYWTVVDGKAGKKYDFIGPPVFSPDGKHVAYSAYKYDKWLVVLDGVEGKSYDGMFTPGYPSDQWRPRVIFDSPDSLYYIARIGKSIYLVEETIR
jgi:Tol biopolymer transport system component